MAISEAQKRAVAKYNNANYDKLTVRIKKGQRDILKAHAEEQGEIRGKNYKAEAMLRKPNNGDGVSHLSGANNKPTRGNKNNSIFELADGAR